MAQNLSKTARASTRVTQGAKGALQLSGDIDRIVPLNDGHHAYVRTDAGTTVHYATRDSAFIDELMSLDEDGRITVELTRLANRFPDHGWDRVAKRLRTAQAPEPDSEPDSESVAASDAASDAESAVPQDA